MTGNIEIFSNLDENVKSEVIIGNDSRVSVKGKGRVSTLTGKGENKFWLDVYYVPGFKCNLLSIGQLMNKGYNVFFKNDVCTIMDIPPSKRVIAEVHTIKNKLFPLKLITNIKEGGVVAAVTQ